MQLMHRVRAYLAPPTIMNAHGKNPGICDCRFAVANTMRLMFGSLNRGNRPSASAS